MADQFNNARAYFDPRFPSSGDGFSISGFRNVFASLAQLDFLPLQPRAHNPANASIMIRGRDASSFYNPIYASDSNSRIFFASGDTGNFSAPASNPRIDIVYITPSGDIKIQQGVEAASPTLPSLAPSGDTRFPICAVFNRVGQAKVVNFEDKGSNTGDGYIYQDLRPWLNQPKSGGSTFSGSTPVSPTGDSFAGPGTATTAARSDHVHGGVRSVKKVGSAIVQGEVEFAGNPAGVITQAGNRLTINSPFTVSYTSPQQTISAAGQLVLAHGLGAMPSLIQLRIVNIVSEGNYSIGDELIINPETTTASGASRGVSCVPDPTNITIRFGSSAGVIDFLDKTTGGATTITVTSWKLVVRAWA